MRAFNEALGITEADFMAAPNALFGSLESTSIYLAEVAIEALVGLFPTDRRLSDADRARINAFVDQQ